MGVVWSPCGSLPFLPPAGFFLSGFFTSQEVVLPFPMTFETALMHLEPRFVLFFWRARTPGFRDWGLACTLYPPGQFLSPFPTNFFFFPCFVDSFFDSIALGGRISSPREPTPNKLLTLVINGITFLFPCFLPSFLAGGSCAGPMTSSIAAQPMN